MNRSFFTINCFLAPLPDHRVHKRLNNAPRYSHTHKLVRVVSAYRHLFYPSGESCAVAGFARHVLPAQDVGQVDKVNQQDLLLQILTD